MLTTLLSTTVIATVLSFTPQDLWDAWPEERFVTTAAPCLRPAELEESLRALARRHGERLRLEEVGRSVQGRPIYLLSIGQGPQKILLWSQMHGDEPSATPALLDLAHYLLSHKDDPAARAILSETTLLIVPMLNPDGSEVYERRNAQGIDINRDALNLATPEGRLLKKLRSEYQPMLGFNLHDQNRRTAVGDSGKLATNAVLAVAGDRDGTVTPGRLRAKRACSAIAQTLAPFVPGGMARYDEDWSPRAFGDNLTAWGMPVVLIESGAVPPGGGFPDLTRLNFVALLQTLKELVRNDLADYDPQIYEDLLRNQDDAWADLILRGGYLLQPGTKTPYRTDLALDFAQDDRQDAGCAVAQTPRARLVEVGDARFLGASREIDAGKSLISAPWTVEVRGWKAHRWLNDDALGLFAQAGVGTLRWSVAGRHLERAQILARFLERPGRPRLLPVAEAAPRLLLSATGPPRIPTEDSWEARLLAVAGESWSRLRKDRSLFEVLMALEEERQESALSPPIRRGQRPSLVLLSPFDPDDLSLPGARLRSVWLEGVEVISQ